VVQLEPKRRTDAVDEFFRAKQPPNAIVLRVLWSDNPFFPKTLNEERLNDLKLFPERYAATQRIEAARRLLPRCSFNEATTSAGREALGAYHEKRDENRGAGLGPEHDWSSHAADAFGLMCIAYRDPRELAAFHRKILDYPRMSIA
jgi:hypothetical protein